MKKLTENWDKAIWEYIDKLSDEELSESEKILGEKFPEKDRKYIKAYNRVKAVNVFLKINNTSFKVSFVNLKLRSLERNKKIFSELKEEFFPERRMLNVIIGLETIRNEWNEYSEFDRIYYIAYDFTKNEKKPEYVLIIGDSVVEDFTRKNIEGTVKLEKLENIHSIEDLFECMYVTDETYEKEEVFWTFRETATAEDIKEFQDKLGIVFPPKYEELLNKAREEGVKSIPTYWNKKMPKEVIDDTGGYITLDEVKETYEIYLEHHKPYPKKLIPISELGNGDCICLDYRGKFNKTLKEPKITYYVHDEIGNRRFINIADNYDEYLSIQTIDEARIKEREEEIRNRYSFGKQPLED